MDLGSIFRSLSHSTSSIHSFMKWFSTELTLEGRSFSAYRSIAMGGKDCRRMLREHEGAARGSKSALFIRWIPVSFRPLDADNPERGYVSDDDPDQHELWRIEQCSVDDSTRIALFHFNAPASRCFRDPHFDRIGILNFIRNFSETAPLELDFVCESYVGFRFYSELAANSQELFKRIAEYRRRYFIVDDDAEAIEWQWHLFQKDRSFSLGVA